MTISLSPALKAHLESETPTTALLWRVALRNGTVLGFTNHDRDIAPDSSLIYVSSSGYSRSDISTSASLEVDALEVKGFLASPALTEADLAAGIWDFAAIKVSKVNYEDLSMGELVYRVGTLGQVTLDRGQWKAELRGMANRFLRVLCETTTPSCRAVLGDARCKVDLSGGNSAFSFTVTSALTGVAADNRTLYDTARDEPGPSAGVDIDDVTNAAPGHVTLAAPLGLPSGSPIAISGVVGMEEINTTTTAENVASDGLSFDLPVDTTGFGAYSSGGKVIGLGSGSGFFDNGVITFTTGANAGLSMEVQRYVPGVIVLALPMPYACQAGDAYSMHAGCDYSLETCRDRFNNVVNFRGEPYTPGLDKLMAVGKH